MPSALTLENMSPGLLKVVERAKRDPESCLVAVAPRVLRQGVTWVLNEPFFDSIDRSVLVERLRERGNDGSLRRRVGKPAEDAHVAPPTGHHGRRRRLPTPSARAGQGAARHAHGSP